MLAGVGASYSDKVLGAEKTLFLFWGDCVGWHVLWFRYDHKIDCDSLEEEESGCLVLTYDELLQASISTITHAVSRTLALLW